MKNLFYMLGIAAISATTATAQNSPATFIKGPAQARVSSISPNGKYAVGYDNASMGFGVDYFGGFKSFIWDIDNNSTEWKTIKDTEDYDQTGSFRDINDDGVICGVVKNKNMIKTISDWGETYTNPLNSAAVWKNGKLTVLGTGNYTIDKFSDFSDGSFANAISNDSKTIVGNLSVDNAAYLYPCAWVADNSGNYKYVSYTMPEGAYSGAINDVSADGKIAVGWYQKQTDNGPLTTACYWTSPENCISITDPNIIVANGAAYAVSQDGNYIAFTFDEASPALFSVKENKYVNIGKYDNVSGLIIGGVTDSGDIFGIYKYGNYFTNQYTRPFWYSKSNKMLMDYDYFVKLWAADAQLPYKFSFESKESTEFAAVSADGRIFAGNGGTPWILKTDAQDIALPITVSGLKTKLIAMGSVKFSFTSPENLDSRYTVKSYNIYRDGSKIGTVDASQVSGNIVEFTDNNVTTGQHIYTASVVVYDNEGKKEMESPRSNTASIFMEDTFNMPLYDNFDSGTTDYNYWTFVKEYGETDYQVWGCPMYTGLKSTHALFTSVDQLIPYSYYLKSRHIDATEKSSVYVSYCNIWNYVNKTDWPLENDTISLEISTDDDTWVPVYDRTIADLGETCWKYEYIDITPWAAGKLFSLRFRIHGQAKAMFDYIVDDFMVAEQPLGKEPEGVLSSTDEDGKFRIAWKNSIDAYPLTYMANPYFNCYQLAVGDEGNPFIAANLFTKNDLQMYKGKYLTSVTTLINHDEYIENTKDTKASIVVFEDDKLVREQPINVKYNEDIVVKLDEPLLIDGTKDIKIGMKIYDYDERQMPIAYHNTNDFIAGKSDLYSQDGGATWNKLSDFYANVEGQETDGYAAWEITGNVTDFADTNVPEALDYNYFASEVYKNGEKYTDGFVFCTQNGFTDRNSLRGDTYQIRHFYTDGNCSELSASVRNDGTSGINALESEKTNSISNFKNASDDIYNAVGQKVSNSYKGLVIRKGIKSLRK